LVAVLPARVDDQLGEGESRTRVDAPPRSRCSARPSS
jgi:hypothetical protein